MAPGATSDFAGWIGRSESAIDEITATPCAALSAMLDHTAERPPRGTPLPPLWHWLYFLPLHRQSDIGPDGHAKRGGFLPPVPLPRRMWAGSRFEFHRPLRIGDRATRVSTIADVADKSGRSGPLVFVKVRHELRANDDPDPAIVELHDVVYREAPKRGDRPPPPTSVPAEARWRRRVVPDAVLLFRYSALTFNGHRIHYDRKYVTEVEGYPGLVVHGPLVATLLLDLLRSERPDAVVQRFHFRAVRPLLDVHPFDVTGEPSPDGRNVRLLANDHEGWLAMEAAAELA